MQNSQLIYIACFTFLSSVISAQIPQFTFAKRLGGIGAEGATAMAVDAQGNVYTTGTFTGTADFDPGAGTFNLTAPTFGIFVSKLDASGNFKWARQLGIGNGFGICVDANGNVYTTGRFIGTSDFDPGAGTFNLTSVGNTDIFISKLDSLGNFVWAKSMGGTNEDVANDITYDESGKLAITGYFRGNADFDPGAGAFNLMAGFIDVFVTVVDTAGNFQWAKRLGGGINPDGITGSVGNSVKFDEDSNVVIAGYFSGTGDFDPGVGTLNMTSAGDRDIFVSKLNSSGQLLWSKQMGGESSDQANDIVVDNEGNVYTTGVFDNEADFNPDPDTKFELSGIKIDIFVSKLDSEGNFVFAKQMGGELEDVGQGIFVDSEANIYTTGNFFNTADFDPGPDVFELSVVGNNNADIFISKLDENGNFVYAIKAGGLQNDGGISIHVDENGSIYNSGAFFGFVDFDPSEATFHLTSAGSSDIYVQKFCQISTPVISGPSGYCPGEVITLTSSQADHYLWSNGDTTQFIVVSEPGDYSLTVTNEDGCTAVSSVQSIQAYPSPDIPVVMSDGEATICEGDSLVLSTQSFTTYNWNSGQVTHSIIVYDSGVHIVTVTNEFGCTAVSDPFLVQVLVVPIITIAPSTVSFCEGDSLLLEISNIDAESYLWSTGDTTSAITIRDPGEYYVEVTFSGGCTSVSNTITVTVNPLPEIDLGDNIILESGESVNLNAGPGHASYQWSTGAIGEIITVDEMGEYCVTVTNIFGCTASDCVTISIVTSSDEENTAFKLSVSPNPGQDVIFIQSDNFGISSIQLINNQGKIIFSELEFSKAGEKREMDIGDLAPGLYYLQVRAEGVFRTIPVIKK